MFNRRIFVLNFRDEDLPKFTTDEEVAAWHQMLGRMLAYGLHHDHTEDTMSLVTGGIYEKGTETCMTYHADIPEYQEKWPDGSTKCIGSNASLLNDTLASLTKESSNLHRGFTMAAIKRDDGYSYHS